MKIRTIYIAIIAFALALNCKAQNEDIKTIDKFIKNVILNDDFDFTETHNYLKIPKDSLKGNTESLRLLKNKCNFYSTFLKNREYKILPFSEAKKLGLTKNSDIDYNNTKEIYLLLVDDARITTFLVQNNKILSFFTGNGRTLLIKSKSYGGNPKKPYFF
ncbi:MAG: hypothetical protein AB8B52_04675 [Winogradskyella sp.]|uniref:hypothetical protein n=1 Tax=Winogradskyella sp. TaxID=1883156 RepID=UPI00385FFDA6